MPTVVIIHAAEDTLPARALAEKLRLAKLTVVLEKPPGAELRDALNDAQISIALWSPRSVSQGALIEDASFARGKTKMFHACMQSAPTPDQFRGDRSVNLTGWRGEDDFAGWRELAKLVTDKAGVKPLPPPAPRPPSGFFQPGRPTDAGPPPRLAPRAQQPRQAQRPAQSSRPAQRPSKAPAAQRQSGGGGGNGLVIAIAALVAVALLGGGGYYFWNQSQGAQTTSAVWNDVERNDASALRAFLEGNPGAYRDEAEAALRELEVRTYEAASDADSIEALEAFLSDFPDSEHALAARGRVAELQSLPQPPTEELVEETPADPDLVPPGSTETGGPAPITPPAEPAPEPPPVSGPTN